tara:strand:+ start:2358 stop:2654 length:297 start_codon:yes stop_codon:yes gene_type:complete
MLTNSVIKALADIYIAVEETSKPMDIFNSRPRKLPENIDKVYNELVDMLAEHFGESEESLVLQIRPLIRKAIPLGGANIGYADEGLSLAQMCGRAIRR